MLCFLWRRYPTPVFDQKEKEFFPQMRADQRWFKTIHDGVFWFCSSALSQTNAVSIANQILKPNCLFLSARIGVNLRINTLLHWDWRRFIARAQRGKDAMKTESASIIRIVSTSEIERIHWRPKATVSGTPHGLQCHPKICLKLLWWALELTGVRTHELQLFIFLLFTYFYHNSVDWLWLIHTMGHRRSMIRRFLSGIRRKCAAWL